METVTVCCKHPNGLILRMFEKKNVTEGSPMGARSVQQWVAIPGSEFPLNGYQKYFHLEPNMRDMFDAKYPGGYAITRDVPKTLWDQFVEIGHPSLDSGMVFAVPKLEDAEVEAKSRRAIRSNLEPISPEHPELTTGREPEVVNIMGRVGKIEPGSRN